MPNTVIVVPCYDEADRLPETAFVDFVAATPGIDLVFVDDGSRDATLTVLRRMVERDPARLSVIALQPNRGKAEAVRTGICEALRSGAEYAGFLDADLATPLPQVPRMIDFLQRRPDIEMVFGSRVHLLGRRIERRKTRHYLGRVFATVASRTLRLPIYDTQCGAKLFRNTPEVAGLFATPFLTRWLFDVEIVARLIDQRRGTSLPGAGEVIYELPVDEWMDVAGSKVRPLDFVRAIRELWRIRRHYHLGRRAAAPAEMRAGRRAAGGSPPGGSATRRRHG